jgi:glycosyltransferase involved in cell wall biosynthesis
MADGLTDHEMAELYRRADVFVTASSHEGFCVPIVEAMAMSTPVVASAVGAIPETAGSGALLIDEQSAESYAEAMAFVLDDDTSAELVLAGRERAAELSLDVSGAALRAFLDRRL